MVENLEAFFAKGVVAELEGFRSFEAVMLVCPFKSIAPASIKIVS